MLGNQPKWFAQSWAHFGFSFIEASRVQVSCVSFFTFIFVFVHELNFGNYRCCWATTKHFSTQRNPKNLEVADHIYVNRTNTNAYVYKSANEVLNAPADGPHRKIKPLTEVLDLKRLKLLGHILRHNRTHQQHQVTFTSYSANPRVPVLRRVGRPRKNWTIENLRKAWELIQNSDRTLHDFAFDITNRQLWDILIAKGRAYEHPFD